MNSKKTITLQKLEKQINEILSEWAYRPIIQMIQDVAPIITLYATESNEAICLKEIDPSEQNNVRLLRTVYLLSKFAENHAGKLASLKCKHPMLWEHMEKNKKNIEEIYEDEKEDNAPAKKTEKELHIYIEEDV